jgi:uncharacterized surface protein with fasciclin (FAS1) repeats
MTRSEPHTDALRDRLVPSVPLALRIGLMGYLILALSACGAGIEPTEVASPPATEADGADPAAERTIAAILQADERFSRFTELAATTMTTIPGTPSLLEVWDMPASQLGAGDGITIFAPTDAAFEALEPEILAALESGALDNDLRVLLISNHYVHRPYLSADFENGPVNVRAGRAEITLDPLTFGGQRIVDTDIEAANGYLHVLDGVVISDDLRARLGD